MISAHFLLNELRKQGVSLFTGIPCSILKSFFDVCLASSDIRYITSQNEGESAAIALGAELAGISSVVICQNSALGELLLPLTYARRCNVGLFFIISWKGHVSEKKRWIGDITLDLLRTFDVEVDILSPETTELEVKNAIQRKSPHRSRALLIIPGTLSEEVIQPQQPSSSFYRSAAIEWLTSLDHPAIILTPDSYATRELFGIKDQDQNLYLVPLGYVATVGLGIALHHSNTVVVIDGDGSVLMRMSNLLTIANQRPPRFIHIIFDNNGYGTTGGQPLNCHHLSPIMQSIGYSSFSNCSDLVSFQNCYLNALKSEGPHFIVAKVAQGSELHFPALNKNPSFYADRFKKYLQETYV